MGMGIKKRNRQSLHMLKHLIPDFFQTSLRHNHHQTVIEVSGAYAHQINQSHRGQRLEQRRKIGRFHSYHWCNVIINQCLEKQASAHIRQYADHDPYHYKHTVNRISFHNYFQDSLQCLNRILGLGTALDSPWSAHCRS